MPYDALGNYVPGDEPNIDQMQYELAKKGQLPRPLDQAIDSFKQISTHMNPMLMPLYLRDAGKMITNMASPFVGVAAGALSNIQAKGAEQLHRLAGDEASAQEAAQRVVRPDSPEQAAKFYSPLQTPLGQATEEGLAKAFDILHLPAGGPGSGMPGSAPVSPRPFFTPNDLRVVGAEATRVGRQIGEIPTDFINAQSGLQRIDPVTGKPVLGARLQSTAEQLGDIMEQRRMQGLTPIPGLPATLQPQTSMYAVRHAGTRITSPTIPETAKGYRPELDPVNQMIIDADLDPQETTANVIRKNQLSAALFDSAPSNRAATLAFRNFMDTKAMEMFPEAGSSTYAREMFNARYANEEARKAKQNEFFNEFIQTPEGQQVLPNAASTEELGKRHEAAMAGLKNMWGNYLIKQLGTEGNPLVKMAAEKGLTALPEEDVRNTAAVEKRTAERMRQNAGMPIEGSFAGPINEVRQQLDEIALPLQNAANAQQSLGEAAHLAGKDPASVPEFLEARKQATKLTNQRNELEKKLDRLTLAQAYETIEDAAVGAKAASSILSDINFAERQFYPQLKEAAQRGEMAYRASSNAIEQTGLPKMAKQFYADVMSKKIPTEKAATYPVDKYIRENAEGRIKKEKEEEAQFQAHKAAVIADLKATADALPDNKKFGNVGVVELNKDTLKNVANREAAASTEALDICIGEGGSGEKVKNLFTGKKGTRYTPIVNLLTGEPNPKASRHNSGWVDGMYNHGEELPMFRDLETGMPVAAFQFMPSSARTATGAPKFNIGYASGEGNGRIETKYVNGIRDYLNSRADEIAGIGSNLETNTGIYDTRNPSSLRNSTRESRVSPDQMKVVDWDTMPRFMTANDIKQAVQGAPTTAVAAQSPLGDLERYKNSITENLDLIIDDAVHNSELNAPESLMGRLRGIFSELQSNYLNTFTDEPISSLNRAIGFLYDEYDRRMSVLTDLSSETADGIENAIAQLESLRDELQRRQQAQPAAPQTQSQVTENNIRDAMMLNMPSHEVSGYTLLEHAFNDIYNVDEFNANPQQVIHDIREQVLGQMQYIGELTDDELRDYGIESQLDAEIIMHELDDAVQRLNDLEASSVQPRLMPTAVQQPTGGQVSSSYRTALTPNTGDQVVDRHLQALTNVLDEAGNNLFGNGHSTLEIIDSLQDNIRSQIPLIQQNRDAFNEVQSEALTNRLNEAYGNLTTVREGLQAQQMQPIEEVRHLIDFQITTDPIVNNALQQYSQRLQEHAATQFQNGVSPVEIADGLRDTINAMRNVILADPANFGTLTPDQVNTYVGALRNTIDGIGQWLGEQPQPMPELNFEPDETHPANQPYTTQSTVDMARDLFEQERMDVNIFHIPSIEESINALRAGMFDDERIRQLPERQRQSFAEDVAFRLQNMLDEYRGRQAPPTPVSLNLAYNTAEQYINENLTTLRSFSDLNDNERNAIVNANERNIISALPEGLSDDDIWHVLRRLRENRPIPYEAPPTPVPAQPATAPYEPIDRSITGVSRQELLSAMPVEDVNAADRAWEQITDVNSPEEIQNIIGLVRTHPMGPWANFSDSQRELLARELEDHVRANPPTATDNVFGATGQTLRITDRDRELYSELNDMLDHAIEEGYPLPDLGDNEAVARLIMNDEVGGDINNATDVERRRLASLVRRYGVHSTLPRGHREGGRIRNRQSGGTVSTIPSVEQMRYELMMRRN